MWASAVLAWVNYNDGEVAIRSFGAKTTLRARNPEVRFKHRVRPNLAGDDLKFGQLATDHVLIVK